MSYGLNIKNALSPDSSPRSFAFTEGSEFSHVQDIQKPRTKRIEYLKELESKVKQKENECKSLSIKYVQVQRRYKELSIKRNELSEHLAISIQNSKKRDILLNSIKQEIKSLQTKLDKTMTNSFDKNNIIIKEEPIISMIYDHNKVDKITSSLLDLTNLKIDFSYMITNANKISLTKRKNDENIRDDNIYFEKINKNKKIKIEDDEERKIMIHDTIKEIYDTESPLFPFHDLIDYNDDELELENKYFDCITV